MKIKTIIAFVMICTTLTACVCLVLSQRVRKVYIYVPYPTNDYAEELETQVELKLNK